MRCGQCHISIFRLGSIAQARFGEVRFSEQETDLERKSLTFIYITQTFSTGNSWGSICLLLVLSYSLKVFGHMFKSRHLSFPFFSFLFLSPNAGRNSDLRDLVHVKPRQQHLTEHNPFCVLYVLSLFYAAHSEELR